MQIDLNADNTDTNVIQFKASNAAQLQLHNITQYLQYMLQGQMYILNKTNVSDHVGWL